MNKSGLILVIVGAVLLAHNLDWLPWSQLGPWLRTWWPLLLIALGVLSILRSSKEAAKPASEPDRTP